MALPVSGEYYAAATQADRIQDMSTQTREQLGASLEQLRQVGTVTTAAQISAYELNGIADETRQSVTRIITSCGAIGDLLANAGVLVVQLSDALAQAKRLADTASGNYRGVVATVTDTLPSLVDSLYQGVTNAKVDNGQVGQSLASETKSLAEQTATETVQLRTSAERFASQHLPARSLVEPAARAEDSAKRLGGTLHDSRQANTTTHRELCRATDSLDTIKQTLAGGENRAVEARTTFETVDELLANILPVLSTLARQTSTTIQTFANGTYPRESTADTLNTTLQALQQLTNGLEAADTSLTVQTDTLQEASAHTKTTSNNATAVAVTLRQLASQAQLWQQE